MQSSFILMCNGAFICAVCLIREIPPMVKRTRKPSAGVVFVAVVAILAAFFSPEFRANIMKDSKEEEDE